MRPKSLKKLMKTNVAAALSLVQILLQPEERRSSAMSWTPKINSSLLVIFLGFMMFGNSPLYPEGETSSFRLANGLRVCLVEKNNVPLWNAVVAVNLGSKDETAETSGLTHILEHYILFRGTELRSGSEVSRDIRRHGAYFNAHTGEDLSLFEISVPAEDAAFALRNQREILFNLKLDQAALDQEKEVILEEISHWEDDPKGYALSLVYQHLFKGHPYQNPVFGTKEVIQGITVEKMEQFYRRFFTPSNCSLAVVGDFNVKEMEGQVRSVFGEITGKSLEKPAYSQARPLAKNVELTVEMDVNKAYLVIGTLAPGYSSPDQYPVDVLTEILGRSINPMLYSALSGDRRLVETVNMAYYVHKYGGVIAVFLTLDPKNIGAAKREAVDFLRKTRTKNYAPEDFSGEEKLYAFDFLAGAKNQIRRSAYRAQERGLLVASSLASFMLLKEEGREEVPYLDSIDKVSSSDLREAAGKYLCRSEYVFISIIPGKKSQR